MASPCGTGLAGRSSVMDPAVALTAGVAVISDAADDMLTVEASLAVLSTLLAEAWLDRAGLADDGGSGYAGLFKPPGKDQEKEALVLLPGRRGLGVGRLAPPVDMDLR